MKLLLAALAVAGLGGCAAYVPAYPDPYAGGPYPYAGAPYPYAAAPYPYAYGAVPAYPYGVAPYYGSSIFLGGTIVSPGPRFANRHRFGGGPRGNWGGGHPAPGWRHHGPSGRR